MSFNAEVTARRFGLKTDWREDMLATDADLADKIVASNFPDRLFLLLMNLSTQIVIVRSGAPASLTRGIRLAAGGGFVSWNVLDEAVMCSLEWHAISDADNSAIYTMEVFGIAEA